MFQVIRHGRPHLEADACGIGFLASRKGVADRAVVENALELCRQFDHRGAPGHGAGVQLDIPWPLLLDRFPDHAKLIAQQDLALGMFFLPLETTDRRRCTAIVEELAHLAGSEVLQWAEVPINPDALPEGSSARMTMPKVRQAIFRRPEGMSEDGWFACRYLLRLAIDEEANKMYGDNFAIVSLSNRTVVYKGLAELSRIGDLYPDLQDPHFRSRYVLFHSRYCTNTTTAWRRAQPFWALAHNGEISTIQGNVAWMQAIGRDLIANLVEQFPSIQKLASRITSVVCPGGSDTANLDDMLIALLAGGMNVPQAILALLPQATSTLPDGSPLRKFNEAMEVFLGACDGPAAIVACDGDYAVAHLDRNGLRPLWMTVTKDFAFASSEPTGTFPLGPFQSQRIMGPGETMLVHLADGAILTNEQVHDEVGRKDYPRLPQDVVPLSTVEALPEFGDLTRLQRAFGMGKEDIDVVLTPLLKTGKPAVGSMGDDTSPAAMLDQFPRRIEDYFALRFAQETSPPIDPIRDAWVFDSSASIGNRSGLFGGEEGLVYRSEHRVISLGECTWLSAQQSVTVIDATFEAASGTEGLEVRLSELVAEATAIESTVLVLSDRKVDADRVAVPMLRLVSRLHEALIRENRRHRVGLVADAGVWDIHHCALLVSVGADVVCPWLGAASAGEEEYNFLKGIRSGFIEAMSMMGVTPSSAYCGARLIEAIGLDKALLAQEFPNVPGHLEGIAVETLNEEWLQFHQEAFVEECTLPDFGEYRHTRSGRAHANNADIVRNLQSATGYSKKIHEGKPGTYEAYQTYAKLVSDRSPITLLDCLHLKPGTPIPIDEVESELSIAWRFMAPGMSEGALSSPAHMAVASGLNLLRRYISVFEKSATLTGIGPIANSGEGGFEKERIGTRFGNRSVQYSGGRFTITPWTAATALEAEVKFAQGAKPGKGGQLPGKKVSIQVARQRGCEPGYELISPPINHNLYSIEDVKLMIESWRHLNPSVNCALKFVATHGIEMVVMGGVNAGANRLHISDGCGGTGAAKRVDQKHAGIPVAAVLPNVHETLLEEGVRHLVEISVDGGVQNGEQALKLMHLGADRVGIGTSLLIAVGCSMLRKCHLAGPDPADPTGKRRLGCAPGVATQDPALVAKFQGKGKHVARYLLFMAREVRELMAANGIRSLSEIIGRRDRLEPKPSLCGKSAQLDFGVLLAPPISRESQRDYALQSSMHAPTLRAEEIAAAEAALRGESQLLTEKLTNIDRCVGIAAAGYIARAKGDLGLTEGKVAMNHTGAAGHYYGAYLVNGMDLRLTGSVADSAFTAAYGGTLVVRQPEGQTGLTVVGNAFGYGARGGTAFIAGRAGNRFGVCFRKNPEGGGPTVVVEGVESNAFQYMTGGVAVVLGPTGFNLGAGMTGGKVYLMDADLSTLNPDYVHAVALEESDIQLVTELIQRHADETGSKVAVQALKKVSPQHFVKVVTKLLPESLE